MFNNQSWECYFLGHISIDTIHLKSMIYFIENRVKWGLNILFSSTFQLFFVTHIYRDFLKNKFCFIFLLLLVLYFGMSNDTASFLFLHISNSFCLSLCVYFLFSLNCFFRFTSLFAMTLTSLGMCMGMHTFLIHLKCAVHLSFLLLRKESRFIFIKRM